MLSRQYTVVLKVCLWHSAVKDRPANSIDATCFRNPYVISLMHICICNAQFGLFKVGPEFDGCEILLRETTVPGSLPAIRILARSK